MSRLTPALMAAFMLATPALAEPARQIAVTGEGEISLAPDMAQISIGVTAEAPTAGEAMAEMSAHAREVLDMLLTEEQLDSADVQTGQLSLYPRHDQPDESGPRIVTFVASTSVDVRVRDLTRLGGLLDAVVSEGANGLNGLSFGLQDPSQALEQARRAAVADAQARAALYAEAAGVSLGPVLSISEQGGYGGGPMPMMMAEAVRSAVPVQAGEIAMTASISIVYEIAPDDEMPGQ